MKHAKASSARKCSYKEMISSGRNSDIAGRYQNCLVSLLTKLRYDNQTTQQGLESLLGAMRAMRKRDGSFLPEWLGDEEGKGSAQAAALAAPQGRDYNLVFERMREGFAYHKVLYDEMGAPVDIEYVDANKAFEQQTGLRLCDVIGRRLSDIYPKVHLDGLEWIRLFGRLAAQGGHEQHEVYNEEADRWFLLSAFSSEKGYFAGLYVDITERKKAEERQRISSQRLQNALRIARTGSLEFDFQSGAQHSSEELHQIFGYPGKADFTITFQDIIQLVHEPDRAAFKALLDAAVASPTLVEGDFRFAKVTKEVIHVHATIHVERSESGRPLKLFSTYQDVTASRCLQDRLELSLREVIQANKAKSDFVATMSHEVRTPMNAIKGLVELLKETPLSTDQRKYIEIVGDSIDHLVGIMNEVLEYSRAETDSLEIARRPFAIREDLESTAMVIEGMARKKGLDFELAVVDSVPRTLVGDYGRIRQVLLNLASNAVKFTERGAVRIQVSAAPDLRDAEGGVSLRVDVTDTGIGISHDSIPCIFERFTRLQDGLCLNRQGAGLGLAICDSLVKKMGGLISVESSVGKGSTFSCIIPCGVQPEAAPRDEGFPAAQQQAAQAVGNLRILVAEDEPNSALLLKVFLSKNGHTVSVARDGREVLDILRETPCDILLLDLQMPSMDGLQVAKEIRSGSLGEETAGMPIIAITAHAFKDFEELCAEAGFDHFMTKPVRFKELLQAITMCMSKGAQAPGMAAGENFARGLVLNAAELDEQFGGDRQFESRIVASFLERDKINMGELCTHVDEADFAAAARVAHYMKSSFDTIFAERCSGLARKIENAAKEGDEAALKSLYPELVREDELLQDALIQRLAGTAPRSPAERAAASFSSVRYDPV
ncbi:PAS/PAC sensor hybrid histidine kinase [Desulfovibrio sp. X2]|uniref:PAS domain-containing hybrid sensor histidine kinase/response regulator n=1 Tax=Desulfovibrio sp. X2 TaxID=941449 RepID=UPI000358BE74|nr:PAS domain-containing hybrid sensor histidine kinase/response regulator [Desulfovibrio sp. X2]EPR37215.1 PAS/PAC sensor hybrid histidine kinase [Desulfovibrio sp. X2]